METTKALKLEKDGVKEIKRKISAIVIGNLLCSIAFNLFFIPNELVSGGVGGIGIMVQYLTGIPSGIAVFCINLPIFLIGAKMIDKKFIIYAFISAFIFSTWLTITKDISQYLIIDDILLGSIFGAIFNGVGMGIMFKNGTCQGGLDVVAAILKRRLNINIGTGLTMVNTVVISLSSLLFGYKSSMYTLIAMYIGYTVLDKVQVGFNTQKNAIIVSERWKDLSEEIKVNLNRGVTFLKGQGGYTYEDKNILYCILTTKEVAKLKEVVNKIDPTAFLTITDVVEVKGKGFKSAEI